MLERFQNPDCKTAAGETAIMKASKRGDLDILELLLRAGADVNHTAENGSTPLLVAAEHGQLVVVRRLVGAGADSDLVTGLVLRISNKVG